MNLISKLLAGLAGFALLIGLYFSENIRGYYRFKEICEKEAGLKVLDPLERNVGWTVMDANGVGRAEYLLHYFDGVAFVRHRSGKDGFFYDLRRNPVRTTASASFISSRANPASSPKYSYRETRGGLESESRMSVRSIEIIDLDSEKVTVSHKDFGYRSFSVDWGYGGNSCSQALRGNSVSRDVNLSKEHDLKSAFTTIKGK